MEELIKTKFVSCLRDLEASFRLLDCIKTKPTMTLSEMAESLQFRSKAMAFASSSTGSQPVIVMEELGYNIEENFRKASEKLTGSKGNGPVL